MNAVISLPPTVHVFPFDPILTGMYLVFISDDCHSDWYQVEIKYSFDLHLIFAKDVKFSSCMYWPFVLLRTVQFFSHLHLSVPLILSF
jgi:hypothetical protein